MSCIFIDQFGEPPEGDKSGEASDSGVLDVNDSDSIESPAESDDDVFDTNDSDSMAELPAESDENEAIPCKSRYFILTCD